MLNIDLKHLEWVILGFLQEYFQAWGIKCEEQRRNFTIDTVNKVHRYLQNPTGGIGASFHDAQASIALECRKIFAPVVSRDVKEKALHDFAEEFSDDMELYYKLKWKIAALMKKEYQNG